MKIAITLMLMFSGLNAFAEVVLDFGSRSTVKLEATRCFEDEGLGYDNISKLDHYIKCYDQEGALVFKTYEPRSPKTDMSFYQDGHVIAQYDFTTSGRVDEIRNMNFFKKSLLLEEFCGFEITIEQVVDKVILKLKECHQ